MIILVAAIIIIRYHCRRQRCSRQSRSSRAGEGPRQHVPHRIESSSPFTVQLPPVYTLTPSNTENAPPSYDESWSTATSALPPPSNMEDAPPSYDETWTTPATSALPPSALTPRTSQPQANEILLVSLPPSHGNNSQNKDNDKDSDSDSDKFAFICKRGFKYPHKTDTMMTCA